MLNQLDLCKYFVIFDGNPDRARFGILHFTSPFPHLDDCLRSEA